MGPADAGADRLDDLVNGILSHHGVKGMHWGIRKDRTPVRRASDSHTFTTAKGEAMTLEGMKTPIIARGLASISSTFRRKLEESDSFAIKNSKGERVGELFIKKDPKQTNATNVVWVETRGKHKGQGYATATMKKVIDIAKKQGRDKVTLEVPGISPDARHIYEKLGFKDMGMTKGSHKGDIWGGLTDMELKLPAAKVKHGDDVMDGVLAHFGVKGMKWGVRKSSAAPATPAHADHAVAEAAKTKLKTQGAHALSNQEFEAMLNRMNLEQRLYNLNDQKRKQVGNAEFLFKKYKGVGKQVLDSPGGKMAKAVATDAIKKKGTKILLKKVTNEGAKAALKLALGVK